MRLTCALPALVLATLALSACGSNENQMACQAYVEHVQGLPCFDGDIDLNSTCPDNYDGSGYSCSEFFNCLTENATCDGDTFVNAGGQCRACTN